MFRYMLPRAGGGARAFAREGWASSPGVNLPFPLG